MSRRRPAGEPPRQSALKRTYPDGRVVWIARYRDLEGRLCRAKPRWNGGRATFARRAEAQRAIDEALAALRRIGEEPLRIGEYRPGWLTRHPRSDRTNSTYAERIDSVIGLEIEGRPLADWYFDELRRRHVHVVLEHLLVEKGRSAQGARGVIRAYSAMAEDAIADDAAQDNAFKGVRLRGNDPRIRKAPRRIRVWSVDQMREFAAAARSEVRHGTVRPPDPRNTGAYRAKERIYSAHDYEALVLTPALTGLRLGEFLALRRSSFTDGLLTFEYSAHEGVLVGSSDQKNHERSVPVPPSLAALYESLLGDPGDPDDPLFLTPSGRMWRERNFYRDVWTPAKIASGMDPTPHEFRHSYITHLRALGIDDADLAKVAGHRLETMISIYTHPLEQSHEAIRRALDATADSDS
jgi:integrase